MDNLARFPSTPQLDSSDQISAPAIASPWLTAIEAADYLRCSKKTIYYLVAAAKLRAAKVGGRGQLRFRTAWLDEYLEATTTPVEICRG